MSRLRFTRRELLAGMAAMGVSVGLRHCLWARALHPTIATSKRKHLVVLWMSGGPSQLDTFDLKVGHTNGGEFQETATNVPGIRFSEHLPKLAKLADQLAIVRSLSTKEGDHSRGTFLIRTGQRPGAPLRYPPIPAALAKELSTGDMMTPDYVSILESSFINPLAYGAGFLGPQHQPLSVGLGEAQNESRFAQLRVDNLKPGDDISLDRLHRRRQLWEAVQGAYQAQARGAAPSAHDTMHRRGMALSDSELSEAFDLSAETIKVRDSYGAGSFGQGCLMARRLVERGVPVVEVCLGANQLSWDTHADNFSQIKQLSGELDAGWSQLMIDLRERNLLEDTTILWIGEFGRTPQINPMGGRDHFPGAFSCVLAGGNIQGGQVYGTTSPDGMEVVDKPVRIEDLLATTTASLGIDPETENYTEGRPVKIIEGTPIPELLLPNQSTTG